MITTLDRLLTTLDVRVHAFAVCEVAPGRRLVFQPMDAVIVHYVLAGTGTLRTGGGGEVPFAPYRVLIVPPRQGQSLGRAPSSQPDVLAANNCSQVADGLVRFSAGTGEGADGILTICGSISATYAGGLGLFDHLREPVAEDAAADGLMRGAFETIAAELAAPGVGMRALSDALMRVCLLLLLRRHLMRDGTASPIFAALQDPRLARAVVAVLERPADAHTLERLAGIAGMSRTTFSERFSEALGRSPADFVQRVRLRRAAHLLRATDLPVLVVARSVGYASRSHFSRAFRAAYGEDPTAFRKRGHAEGDDPPSVAAAAPGARWI